MGSRSDKTVSSTIGRNGRSGIDFQYDYPFDFAGEKEESQRWNVDHIIPSEYRMIIYNTMCKSEDSDQRLSL